MEQGYIILLIILTLGLIIKNNSLSIASSFLILMKLLKFDSYFPKIEDNGLKIGLIILTMGILAPIAQDKYSIKDILISLKSPMGISAVLASILVILFTSKGYTLLTKDPSIVVPIVLGSIIGMIIFKGLPVGPLVASGLAVIIYSIFNVFHKFFS